MKEIEDIVDAYDEACQLSKSTALATVVNVEGSSYRRPGARMLVTDAGELTGAISGGCLEGDALRKALLAISEGKNKLVTYDTTDEDDAKFGVQLGCNGIVHILFEPIDASDKNNPIELLRQVLKKRRDAVLITFFSLIRHTTTQRGTSLLYTDEEWWASNTVSSESALKGTLLADVSDVIEHRISSIKAYQYHGETFTALIDFLQPPVSLVVFGAGNDVIPLTMAAAILGWHTTVIDGRSGHATRQRFPQALRIIVAKAENALDEVYIDQRTVFVLMTHNYTYDVTVLEQLFGKQPAYIGVLGPRQKLQRMLDEMSERGTVITESILNCVYGPVGLDIGAETAEEIAISIIAEIKAVLEGRNGYSLRHKVSAIHSKRAS